MRCAGAPEPGYPRAFYLGGITVTVLALDDVSLSIAALRVHAGRPIKPGLFSPVNFITCVQSPAQLRLQIDEKIRARSASRCFFARSRGAG